MNTLITLFLFIFISCIVHVKQSFTNKRVHFAEDSVYCGSLDNTNSVKKWLEDKDVFPKKLSKECVIFDVYRNTSLSHIVWILEKNAYYTNKEYTDVMYPWIVYWKKQNSEQKFVVDKITRHDKFNTIPFAKNQNETYAKLFELRMKYYGF